MSKRSRLSPLFSRSLNVAIIATLALAFLATITPTHALPVIDCNAGNTASGSTVTAALTSCTSSANGVLWVGVETATGTATCYTATVSDTNTNTFTKVATASAKIVTGVNPTTYTSVCVYIFVATVTGMTTSDTVTMTPSGSTYALNSVSAVFIRSMTTAGATYYNATCSSSCSASPTTLQLSASKDASNGIALSMGGIGTGVNPWTAGAAYTLVAGACTNCYGQGEYSTSIGQTTFPITATHSQQAAFVVWALVGTIFTAATTTTITTTVNQDCNGACSGSYSSNGLYLKTNYLYFYQGVAVAQVSETLYNITTFVKAVHVNTASASLLIAVYAGTSAIPAASTPMSLIWSATAVLSNNSAAQYLHGAPNIQISPAVYYAVAVMATSAAARPLATYGGVGSSGVQIANASASVVATLMLKNVGSSSLPATVYGSTATGSLFLVGYSKFGVVYSTTTITSTSTLTTGGGGVLTSGQQNTITFAEDLVIILAPTVALALVFGGVSRSGAGAIMGGLTGFATGTGLGYYAGVVPVGWVFIAVITLVAMILFAVMALRGSGV